MGTAETWQVKSLKLMQGTKEELSERGGGYMTEFRALVGNLQGKSRQYQ